MNGLKGTLKECFRHLIDTTKAADRPELTQQLSSELSVNAGSVRLWMRNATFPKGIFAIRLAFSLMRRGYAVTELARLRPELLHWGWLLANGKTTIADSTKAVGYATTSDAYQPLFGRHDIAPRMLKNLQAFLKTMPAMPAGREELVVASAEEARGGDASKESVISALVALTRSMRALSVIAISDQFTEADRAEIRRRVGGNEIFNLKNDLVALCSETARKSIISN